MIIIQGYLVIYLMGLTFNQLVSGDIKVFKSKTEFKRSFIPFYFFYKWYKNLPE